MLDIWRTSVLGISFVVRFEIMRAVSSLIFFVLLGLVVLAPLPFGSVLPLSWSLIGLVVGWLLIVWVVTYLENGESPPLGLRRTWLFVLPFGLAVAWASLQALSVTPTQWHHPIWRMTAEALGTTVPSGVSLDPDATRAAVFRLITYGGIFWLSAQYCRIQHRARQVLFVLTAASLVYAAYGLTVQFTDIEFAYLQQSLKHPDQLTSTFINRNSYATYAGLGLLCAVAYLISQMSGAVSPRPSRRERLRILLVRSVLDGWFPLLSIVFISTALLLTNSRGGFFSTSLGIATMLLAYLIAQNIHWREFAWLTTGTIVASIALVIVSGEKLLQRLYATTVGGDGRNELFTVILNAFGDSPWLGTGYGTFEDAFRFYRDQRFGAPVALAHNTYLENALELGAPAAIALVLAITVLYFRCMIGARTRRRDVIYPCLGVGATVLVASHSVVDFSLQIPAVAVTYALLMGAVVAQSWSSTETLE